MTIPRICRNAHLIGSTLASLICKFAGAAAMIGLAKAVWLLVYYVPLRAGAP